MSKLRCAVHTYVEPLNTSHDKLSSHVQAARVWERRWPFLGEVVAVSGRGGNHFWERCVFFAEASPAENASQVPVGPIAWERSPSIYCTSPKIPYHLSQNHPIPLSNAVASVTLKAGPESERHPASCWDWRKFRPMLPGRNQNDTSQLKLGRMGRRAISFQDSVCVSK